MKYKCDDCDFCEKTTIIKALIYIDEGLKEDKETVHICRFNPPQIGLFYQTINNTAASTPIHGIWAIINPKIDWCSKHTMNSVRKNEPILG